MNALKIMATAIAVLGFSAMAQADVRRSVERSMEQCGSRFGQGFYELEATAIKGTQVRDHGQVLENFIMKDGRLVVVDTKACDYEHFALYQGGVDKFVDSREASGQLYTITESGKLYVVSLLDSTGRFDSNSYSVREVLTTSGSSYKLRFHSIKTITAKKASEAGANCATEGVKVSTNRDGSGRSVIICSKVRGQDLPEDRLGQALGQYRQPSPEPVEPARIQVNVQVKIQAPVVVVVHKPSRIVEVVKAGFRFLKSLF